VIFLNKACLAVISMAEIHVPVCPRAGGVGLCEYAPGTFSAFDYLRVSTTLENRVTEFVDHLY
jgi:L-fuconate dehydratase